MPAGLSSGLSLDVLRPCPVSIRTLISIWNLYEFSPSSWRLPWPAKRDPMPLERSKQHAEPRFQRRARRVASVLVAVLGLVLLADRTFVLSQGHASLDWPQVEGVVLLSESWPLGAARGGERYGLNVLYGYTVDGQDFEGRRLEFKRSLAQRDEQAALEAMTLLEVGAPVTVFHHPSYPELAVLAPGTDPSAWGGLGFAVLLLVVATIAWTVPVRRQTKS